MYQVKKTVCNTDFSPCPCKIIDLDNNISYCDLVNMFGELSLQHRPEQVNRLLKQICPDKKNLILYHEFEVKRNKEQAKKFLENVKPGDKVFCTAEIHDVIFLEKNTNAYGDCKYKTADGEIKTAPNFAFRILSKGNKFAEYRTENKYKADLYELKGKKYGFRVDRKDLENSFILKFYGDRQEDVDNFVFCIDKDLIIDNY